MGRVPDWVLAFCITLAVVCMALMSMCLIRMTSQLEALGATNEKLFQLFEVVFEVREDPQGPVRDMAYSTIISELGHLSRAELTGHLTDVGRARQVELILRLEELDR